MTVPPTDLPATPYDVDYPARLGRLIANVSMLEFTLRVALYLMDTPRAARRSGDWRIAALSVGDEVEESWLTSWSSLTDLIAAYNDHQAKLGLEPIDAGIADLRNALAHGCITGATATDPYALVRFDRPKGGTVRVLEKYVMTFAWIGEQTRRTFDATSAVVQRVEELR